MKKLTSIVRLKSVLSNLLFASTSIVGVLALPSLASAASLTPSSFEASIEVGETVTINKTLSLDASGPASNLVDVFFLADNTGSMGGIINSVKSSASSILDNISGGDSRFSGIDVAFGVGRYFGDPLESRFSTDPAGNAYDLLAPITKNKGTTQTAINNWIASGGGDSPEANFFALHQVATSGGSTDGNGSTDAGYSTGENTGWRDNAGRVLVWFGDASSHTTTVDVAEAINALVDNNVKVAAINTQNAGFGIDRFNQATDIVAATDGILTNDVSTSQAVDAILDSVGKAISEIDLEFYTTGDTSGVDIGFACTDPLGCEGVKPGESRTFDVNITGKTLGTYNFETGVKGIAGAIEKDLIIVTGGGTPGPTEEVPEPLTILGTLTAGAFGTQFMKKRKQMQAAKSEA